MTITERLQGAGLCLLFVGLCLFIGRSLVKESRAASVQRSETVSTSSDELGLPQRDSTRTLGVDEN